MVKILFVASKDWGIKLKYESLKKRLMLRFGAIVLFTLAIFSLGFYYIFWQNSYYNTKSLLLQAAEEIESKVEKRVGFERINVNYPFAIIKSGVLFKSANFKLRYLQKSKHLQEEFFYPKTPLNGEDAIFVYHLEKKSGKIVVVAPKVDNILERVLLTLAILLPLLFGIFILLLNSVLNSILKPIKQLNKDIEEVSIGNFKKSLAKATYNDEIARLTESFNVMIHRLQSSFKRLKRVNDNISHELKTPLSIMQAEIELALEEHRVNSYYKERLGSLQSQVQKLISMVESLLTVSRYGKAEIAKTVTICDCNAIVLNTIEKLNPRIEAKGIDLEITEFQKAKVKSNCQLLSIAIFNILDNAIKYSHNGKKVEVSLRVSGKMVEIAVQDYGIGIKQEILPKITEEFYKKGRDSDGFGLGLYIVHSIVELLNAELIVESQENRGSQFTLVV